MRQQDDKISGIREIASALGVSLATVDRALHNKVGVSEKTRHRVLDIARKLDYQPNLAARNLKLRRRFHIAVLLPAEGHFYFEQIRQGIRSAITDAHGVNIHLSFHEFKTGDLNLASLSSAEFDVLVTTPTDEFVLAPVLRQLDHARKNVVFVGSTLPRTPHLASVTTDSEISGSIAAELFARTMRGDYTALMMTGDLRIHDHAEKLRGFAASLAMLAPLVRLLPTIETHDDPEEARSAILKLIKKGNTPDAIYVSTVNSLPVLAALEETGELDRIHIVTTDLYPELVPFLQTGKVLASLHQRPYTQGKLAISLIMRHLLQGGLGVRSVRLAPHVILRSSLPLFTNTWNEMEEEMN